MRFCAALEISFLEQIDFETMKAMSGTNCGGMGILPLWVTRVSTWGLLGSFFRESPWVTLKSPSSGLMGSEKSCVVGRNCFCCSLRVLKKASELMMALRDSEKDLTYALRSLLFSCGRGRFLRKLGSCRESP